MTIEIPLTKNKTALIDDIDADLTEFKWCTCKDAYAIRRLYPPGQKAITLYMHRLILERILGRPLVKGELCDHRFGNTFDNRRSELRLATYQQNARNSRNRKYRMGNGRFKGTFEQTNGWSSIIKGDNGIEYLGLYATAEEAYKVYCERALVLFGEFANLPDYDLVKNLTPIRIYPQRIGTDKLGDNADETIMAAFNEHKTPFKAAVSLGVSEGFIRRYLAEFHPEQLTPSKTELPKTNPHKLSEIAEAQGKTVRVLLSELMKEHDGSIYKVAKALGVYPNAIRFHINKDAA